MVFSQMLRLSTASCKRLLLFDTKMDTSLPKFKDFKLNFSSSVKFKPVTHIIFDLDGLLLNTEAIYKNIITEMTESYGKEYTQEIRLKLLGTTEQTTARIVIEECELPLTVDEFLSEFRLKQIPQLQNAKLMDGAEQLIQHFKQHNIPMAVATSSGEKSVALKTRNHRDLFNVFSHFVMGSSDSEVKHGKPAPDIFLVCAQRFKDKPQPEKCLVFEDAPNGVTGGIKAGMQVVMVPESDLPTEKCSHATVVLKSLLDFKPEDFGLPAFDSQIV